MAWLILECLLRLTGNDAARLWEPDPYFGWRHVVDTRRLFTSEGRGWVEINSFGYRDRERSYNKLPGTFRVAVFGDSMTEAFQVDRENSFCYLLEQNLSKKNGPTEVLNFGVSGYSTLQELLLFRQEGPRFRPDLVVLAVFLDNDVADCHPRLTAISHNNPPFVQGLHEPLLFDFSGPERSFAEYRREPKHTLRNNSAVYRTLVGWWYQKENNSGVVDRESIPKRYQLYLQPAAPDWEEAWAIFEAALKEFASDAQRQGIPLMVVSFPAGQAVHAQAWQNLQQQIPALAHANLDLEAPERRFVAIAKKLDVPLLATLSRVQEIAEGDPLFYGNVGHLTARGHRVMAGLIEEFMAVRGVVRDYSSN